MSTAERAADARRRLKLAGYNARKVSVRCKYYSGGSSLHLTIRALGVNVERVKQIASGAENIHRCEITGDILRGGNTFVHVHFARKVREEAESAVRARAEAAFEQVTADPGLIVEVLPGLKVFQDRRSHDIYSRVRDHGEWCDEDGWRDGTRVYPQASALVDLASDWYIRSAGMEDEDDDPCPIGDPDCLYGEGYCHDACEAPDEDAILAAKRAGVNVGPYPDPAEACPWAHYIESL